jgi:hypothetical protein
MKRIFPLALALWTGLLAVNLGGCNGGGGPTRTTGIGKEEWTIRCTRIETPDHQSRAKFFADLLGRVSGLKAGQVRVDSDARGSTIFYGRYEKKSVTGGDLAFPEQYQKDIELIRSLAYRDQTPFFFAGPELLSSAGPTGAEGDVSTAKGTHSLLIAIFYNTATFTERKETAETYVQDLRKRGYPAYYRHDPARSLVFVGDFEEADATGEGQHGGGPRVEQLIARNPDEFAIQTENGHVMIRTAPGGTSMKPPSVLLPLQARSGGEDLTPAPRTRGPGGGATR